MDRARIIAAILAVSLALFVSPALSNDNDSNIITHQGSLTLSSPGPITFGPEGILLVGDPEAAQIIALDVKDDGKRPAKLSYAVADLDHKVAAIFATSPRRITINDLAVHPTSGLAYLSASRGSGEGSITSIFRVTPAGDVSVVSLANVRYARADLPNAPAAGGSGRSNQRAMSITDLAYSDNKVYVAGLSNEEFASTLRVIPLPFQEAGKGTSVEIYHGAHGQYETRAPVRTFAPYEIDDEAHLLAAYTCTPLVKFPVSDLKPGAKVRGTTVAELGNRNSPLDMVVYEKDGKDWILVSNSKRGLMKISTDGLAKATGLTNRVTGGGTAGLSYETIDVLDGVLQLARLDDTKALVVRKKDGAVNLESVALP